MRTPLRGLVLLASVVFTAAPLRPQNDSIGWLESYGDALREAKATHKPIFLEFRCEP
jgi:hypothetical protein